MMANDAKASAGIRDEDRLMRYWRIGLYEIRSYLNLLFFRIRLILLRVQGLHCGRRVYLSGVSFTWPHKVLIGDGTLIEQGVFFKHDGPYSSGKSIEIGRRCFIGSGCEFNIRTGIKVGDDALIASGCRFIDHDHGVASRNVPMREQSGPESPIVLGNDVWLGVNVVVLKGVTIGCGAIVGAGSIVNRSVPAFEIWAGVPAKKIGVRP